MKNYFLIAIFTLFSLISNAQLTGKITNSKGEILPFANIYLEGTTRGTTANTEGVYFLDIPNGSYRIVFQSIGHIKKIESITINGKTVRNMSLDAADVELSEFVIKSNAEDPAYPIIRKAIQNRNYFLNQVKSYSCDVYIKGVQRIADAPKKFMGRDLGDMGGAIDTISRNGIIYLAETVSKLNVSGNEKKEELITSKVSGDDNGFGFNRATLFDFNLYENFNNDLPRKLMSPIAENALNNYRYKLISSSKIDEQTVFKIEVIPLRKEDPTWAGFVYIIDNQWNMYATDVYVTGRSLQNEIVDTVWLKQDFVKLNKDVWRVFNQRLDFKFKLLSFKFKGFFNGVFSNYKLNPEFAKNYFNNELFTAFNATKTNDLTQWESIRPIPLTAEEMKDYHKKDSMQTVHHSKHYIDSIMHKANRFHLSNLLFGYTYRNDYKSTKTGFGSALSAVSFNAVQGLNATLPFSFSKEIKDSMFADTHANWSVDPSVNYSFGEQKWRGEVKGNFLFNYFKRDNLSFSAGQKVQQFNQNDIISEPWAMIQALYEKRHIYYVYDKIFAKIAYQREITNGLIGKISFEAAKRDPLSISTQYSFQKKDALFDKNEPENPYTTTPNIDPNFYTKNALIGNINLMWTPHQKYTTYPWGKLLESATYPIFKLHLQKAFGNGNQTNYSDYSKFELSIEQQSLPVGLVGYSEIRAEIGGFLTRKNTSFIDYKHFNGNDLNLANSTNYMRGFINLPYYKFSTINNYFMVNYQHHFEGFILGKIPLIRRLGLKEIARLAYLNTAELGNYAEAGFGIDNIGYGLFRLIRADLSWQYQDGKINKTPKFLLGINVPF